MSPESVETKVEEILERHDRFGRAIVVAIVVTTLLATLIALLQTRSLRTHDESLDLADQCGALASQVSSRWDSTALLQLDRYRLAENARVRSEQATANEFFGVGPPRAESARDARNWHLLSVRLQRKSGMLAAATLTEFAAIRQQMQGSLPSVNEGVAAGKEGACRAPTWATQRAPGAIRDDRSGAGPDQDPNFPFRYLADNRRETYLLEARRDGASMEAQSAERQFTRLAVGLTLFAVVVFLLGFSLSVYGKPHRHLFATVAGVFVVGATAWCVYAAVRGPHAANPAAAAAYADCRGALERGTYRDDLHAILYFDCAIALEPMFAQAYIDRGIAYSSLTDPHDPTSSTNVELVPPRYQQRSRSDLNTAERLGAINPTLPGDEGAFVFEGGLKQHSAAEMQTGLRLERETARIYPGDPLWAINIAEGELVLGQPWRQAYHHAEALEQAQANAEIAGTDSFVAGALTDLADIATKTRRTNTRLRHQITLAKEDLVSRLSGGSATAAEAVPVTGLSIYKIDVQPSYAEFILDKGSTFKSKDQLVAQWYYRRPKGHVWAAFSQLPELTSPHQDSAGRWFVITPFQFGTYGPSCLPSGDYKLELYVNGRLAAMRTVAARVTRRLEPAAVQDMDVQICRPSTWVRLPARLPGLADGYVSRDHRRGVLTFDVTAEADASRTGKHLVPLLAKALVQFRALLPGRLYSPRLIGFPFLGASTNSESVDFLYPGGELFAAIAVTDSGRAVVGVVFGPESMFADRVDPKTGATQADNLLAGVVTPETTK